MVNNSTDINKTNNYLSPYVTEYQEKTLQHMTLEIQILAYQNKHKNVVGLKRLMGSHDSMVV
jgi:hypothetical protein